MKAYEPVTVGVVNYNGIRTVTAALDSVRALEYEPSPAVIVADDCSKDGSAELIEQNYPEAVLIRNPQNSGSARSRNRILEASKTRLVLIIDNDITLTPDCLKKLADVKSKVAEAGVVHPHILDRDDPSLPQPYNGGWIHYLCAFIPRKELTSEKEYEIFDTVSGAAMLIDKEISDKIGGFDDDYFFNWEDGDFTFRCTISGHPCLNVPGARVYHKSKPRGTSKVFYQVRNRWYFIFKTYSFKTIFLCLPAFAAYEVSLAALMALKGTLPEYIRGSVSALADFHRTMAKRKKVQALKVKKDAEVLRAGAIYVPEAMLGGGALNRALEVYTGIFKLYWEGVRALVGF